MADRYVNYDKLLKERHRLGLDEMSMISKVNAFNHFIDNLPTADVVEVVRCKDCIYYEDGKGYVPYCCNVENMFEQMKPTDFCSYGERK